MESMPEPSDIQLPEEGPNGSYNPDLMGDTIKEEEFNQLPDWKKQRFSEMAAKRWASMKELERERGRNNQIAAELSELRKMVMNGNGHKPAEPQKEGMDAIATPKLREFVTLAEKTLHALSLDPSNEDVRKQAADIDPALLATAREHLARRAALDALGERESKWTAEKQTEAKQRAFAQQLVSEFGNDVMNPQSELMKAAAEEEGATSSYGVTLGREAQMYLAIQRAHQRLSGSRNRMSPSDLQRLNVEGGARREAAPINQIAALKAQAGRGDWKAASQAADLEINGMIAAMRAANGM